MKFAPLTLFQLSFIFIPLCGVWVTDTESGVDLFIL